VRAVSQRFKDALGVSHRRATKITCTVPGGEPVDLRWTAGNVSSSKSSGVRYQASLTLAPTAGLDTFGLVSTPGAVFRIQHGIDYGAGNVELVDCGVYEAAKGAVSLGQGDISLSLVDMWQRLERNRFVSAYDPATGSRAAKIAEAVSGAIPGVVFEGTADGGTFEQGNNLWERDRAKFIQDMATDGSLDAAFDASGAFRIRPEPVAEPTASVWTFRTGQASNITTADRERPFDRLYNTVIIDPLDDTQAWDRVTVTLADPDHPNAESKIGPAHFFYKSPTLETSAQVADAAGTIMQRVLGTTETISLGALSNPALEVGDAVTVAHGSSTTDPGFQAIHIIDSFQMDLRTGSMSLSTRSSALADLQES
jgi:hypothetical protein